MALFSCIPFVKHKNCSVKPKWRPSPQQAMRWLYQAPKPLEVKLWVLDPRILVICAVCFIYPPGYLAHLRHHLTCPNCYYLGFPWPHILHMVGLALNSSRCSNIWYCTSASCRLPFLHSRYLSNGSRDRRKSQFWSHVYYLPWPSIRNDLACLRIMHSVSECLLHRSGNCLIASYMQQQQSDRETRQTEQAVSCLIGSYSVIKFVRIKNGSRKHNDIFDFFCSLRKSEPSR